jgi:hypothetical protein
MQSNNNEKEVTQSHQGKWDRCFVVIRIVTT